MENSINSLYGAIVGDIAGSKYERYPIKSKDFPFISNRCTFTDDTVLTIATADALIASNAQIDLFKERLIARMRELSNAYPHAGFGGMFAHWLRSENPVPYNSLGNGSAMRVSPCGLAAASLDEALDLACASAEVTHNHPEGIAGAQAVAGAIFLAKSGKSKDEIRAFVQSNYYDVHFSLEHIRPTYNFDVTCAGSVPQAVVAFLESDSYEDAVRNAISLGGDTDTQAAIAGSIAWPFYCAHSGSSQPQWCDNMEEMYQIERMLPAGFVRTIKSFAAFCDAR